METAMNVNDRKSSHVKLGQFLLQAGFMNEAEVLNCAELSMQRQRRFGEVATELGFITPTILDVTLSLQKNIANRAITFESASSWLRQSHSQFAAVNRF
ncbi:hypothetical protein BH10CYA1_BH10CYA1_63460 [soil metagenome]